MYDNRSITVFVQPKFEILNHVRSELNKALIGLDKTIIDSTEIVSWELLENAIKYGIANQNAPEAIYNFSLTEKEIQISVSNGIHSEVIISQFTNMMEIVKNSKDRAEPYINRLTEILDNQGNTKSQLGIYKIIAETDFNLDYRIENFVLTVYARLELRK